MLSVLAIARKIGVCRRVADLHREPVVGHVERLQLLGPNQPDRPGLGVENVDQFQGDGVDSASKNGFLFVFPNKTNDVKQFDLLEKFLPLRGLHDGLPRLLVLCPHLETVLDERRFYPIRCQGDYADASAVEIQVGTESPRERGDGVLAGGVRRHGIHFSDASDSSSAGQADHDAASARADLVAFFAHELKGQLDHQMSAFLQTNSCNCTFSNKLPELLNKLTTLTSYIFSQFCSPIAPAQFSTTSGAEP